jgi:hypothetical protein
MGKIPLFVWAAILALTVGASADESPASVAGLTHEEALRLGQRMYREGILSDGTPLKAVAMGDMSVAGSMYTCSDCHRRSGLGSVEGAVVTWPVTGKTLYEPRRRTGAWRPPENPAERLYGRRSLPRQHQAPDARPAYTDETLARLLRDGVDPTARALGPAMPRYILSDRDMAVMVHYLKHLSRDLSPGVDNNTLHFATIVSEGISPVDRDAMLRVLHAHIDAHNSQYRHEERRAKAGPFFHSEMNLRYRRFELDRWELTGPRETWRGQLEAYAKDRPVFALLGGMVQGSWAPVHRFCEEHRLPCLFPITDLPVISDTDWYTLYFSKGLYQEGEAAAAYLRQAGGIGPDARIVQVYRGGERGAAIARGFREAWAKLGGARPVERELADGETLSDRQWSDRGDSRGTTALLLWLDDGVEATLRVANATPSHLPVIFMSSSLLGGDTVRVPDRLREVVYLTYPYSLPGENASRQAAVEAYLESRKIPITSPRIQAKTWFLGTMLSKALREIRSEFYRDYFLEKMEMMPNQESSIAVYPRLTFGPDQRYASKGCYIVQLTKGPAPEFIKRSGWISH